MKNLMFVALLSLGACAAHAGAPAAGHPDSKAECDCSEGCAMTQPGVQASYEESADGAAIVFSTTGAEVSDIQARVAKMATKHNDPHPHHGQAHVAHSARADNIEKGARLVMTPADPSELEALRKHVRERVEKIKSGEAPTKSCARQ